MVFVNSNQSATINGSDGATRNYKQPQTERSGDKRPVTWWRPLICFSSVSYYFFLEQMMPSVYRVEAPFGSTYTGA